MLVLLTVAATATIVGVRRVVDDVRGTARQLQGESVTVAVLRTELVGHEEIAHKLLGDNPVDRSAFVQQQQEISHRFDEAATVFPTSNGMRATIVTAHQSWQKGLAIDDFGTGFLSLSTLASLPVDILKIDRSFVSGQASATPSAPMLEGTLGLASKLSLAVIAEGIEAPEQLDRLRTLGCHMGQGFLLAPPVPEPRSKRGWNQAVGFTPPSPRRRDVSGYAVPSDAGFAVRSDIVRHRVLTVSGFL